MNTTTDTLSFTVAGIPKPKGSLRFLGKGRVVEQVKGSDEWRQTVAAEARKAMRGRCLLTGPLAVHAVVRIAQARSNRDTHPVGHNTGDIDKHARNLLDAMTGVVYRDDSQVVVLTVVKRYAPDSGVSVRLDAAEAL